MGGRTAHTALCKYPERIDGAISIDAAPTVDKFEEPPPFTFKVIEYLSELKKQPNLTKKSALEQSDDFFGKHPALRGLMRNIITEKNGQL